jgi:mitochondrial splicing suppressor protein 51
MRGLETAIAKPFTRLDSDQWLHDRPEKDVYRLLIDAYRMRAADNLHLEGVVAPDGIYAGKADSLQDFRRFLDRVETARKGALLPS